MPFFNLSRSPVPNVIPLDVTHRPYPSPRHPPSIVAFKKPSAFVAHGLRLREHFVGAEVSGIDPGSPADTGLVFAGEIITRVGGISVAGTPKATVQKLLHAQGRDIVVEVMAAPLPCAIFVARIEGKGLGFSIVVDDVAGVVRVAKLARGSAVAQAGLQIGDRIVAINDQLILGVRHVTSSEVYASFRTFNFALRAGRGAFQSCTTLLPGSHSETKCISLLPLNELSPFL